ncbi:MAG TPA: cbb3-type cytochrome c oxidase subunit II [Terracidiphilus sp.]
MQAESNARGAHTAPIFEGWQGVLLVASTYVYFLIFAQFGFLRRLAEIRIPENSLPLIMGAMAIGGVGMSLLAPRLRLWACPSCRLHTGLVGCALTTVWALLPLNVFTAAAVAFTIGVSLGLLTVTLVANLPLWIGIDRPLVKVGVGTALGYFLCNFPPLFTASPRWIALTSAVCCLVALIVARSRLHYLQPLPAEPIERKPVAFPLVLVWFTALVWLDSAAFYIIQNSPGLKAGTWQGDLHLWRAGMLHFAAALVSAWLLARRGVSLALALALAALGSACLLLLDPARVSIAAVLYPIGVSLYSVALVAYPSFLLPAASQAERARAAGYLYALAGWAGSALGIGMGRNLHYVPIAFVAAAAVLFALPWLWNTIAARRLSKSIQIQALVVAVVMGIAFALTLVVHPAGHSFANAMALTPVERGRRVYIAEGCINCHSQYVRPNTADVLMWGPVTGLEEIRREQPPLIGNRRQGPDLSQVGARRSPLWLRIHFMQPRDVSYDSIMPRYDYLFRDGRGDDLIVYLASLNSRGHWSAIASWQPSDNAIAQARSIDGRMLFAEHCATCHAADGAARGKWSASFHSLPPDLVRGPMKHVAGDEAQAQFRMDIARISKFGLRGTDMPGHEYLPDEQIVAIADFVVNQREASQK